MSGHDIVKQIMLFAEDRGVSFEAAMSMLSYYRLDVDEGFVDE
jgi:hypothetical protein